MIEELVIATPGSVLVILATTGASIARRASVASRGPSTLQRPIVCATSQPTASAEGTLPLIVVCARKLNPFFWGGICAMI